MLLSCFLTIFPKHKCIFHKVTVLPKAYVKMCSPNCYLYISWNNQKKKKSLMELIVKFKFEKRKTFVNTLYPNCMLKH